MSAGRLLGLGVLLVLVAAGVLTLWDGRAAMLGAGALVALGGVCLGGAVRLLLERTGRGSRDRRS